MNTKKIISQGAEAIIYREENKIIKERISKSYRIPELDKRIRKRRTKSEAKLVEKASKIISVPELIKVDEKTKQIYLEFIQGKLLSKELSKFPLNNQKEIAKSIGENIGKIHNEDIIHGDLTTSNMILSEDKVYLIDFGLGYISRKIEDKAVDLHLLKQALEAGHSENFEILFEEIRKSYSKTNPESKKILERIKAVERRGRYKH